MKRLLFPIIMVLVLVSCTLINTETDVTGTYLYTGTFISQKLFVNPNNISEGDTIVSAGAILLTWNVFQPINGDEIRLDKSVGNNNSYAEVKTVPVLMNGTASDSILSGNDYYYKLTLIDGSKELLMNEYEIIVPKLYFHSPDISDLNIDPDSFDIIFNDVNPEGTYKITLRDTSLNKLWETTTEDTQAQYEGSTLSQGIYVIEVSTGISDIEESQSVVNTTGLSQFIIQ